MKNVFKPWIALACTCILTANALDLKAQSVGIANTSIVPDAQSILDIQSTTKGILIPRMLTTERVAISPTNGSDLGLLVYDTDFGSYWYWNGTAWQEIPNSGSLPSGGDFIVNGTALQTSANFNIDGNGTLSDLFLTGGDIESSGILRIGSTTDVRVRLDTDGNGSQEFQITNDGGSTPVFTVSEVGNLIAEGRGQFNGNLTLIGANRNLVAGDNFRVAGTSGIDVVIDSDNTSTNAAYRIQKDGSTNLFEIQEDGDIFFSDLVGVGTNLLQSDAAGQMTRSTTDAATLISGTGTATQIAYFNATQTITSEAALFWDATNDRLGVGTASPAAKLNIDAASGDLFLVAQGGAQRMLIDGSGNTTITGKFNSNGIEETSDLRFKTNITDLSSSLEKITQLRGVTYNWKVAEFPERAFNDRTEIGVIAQEVEKIFPELVSTDVNGYKSVQYSHMVPVLLEAIKEQQSIINSLTSEVGGLRSEFVSLKSLIETQLESANK
ncbi:MAG: tail fiber domain-containing protein [Flavobacteriales bacterium]|nr:tail fiber domain-containing protein [Flavobacteriales bacterium]